MLLCISQILMYDKLLMLLCINRNVFIWNFDL